MAQPPVISARKIFWFPAIDDSSAKVVCLEIDGVVYTGRLEADNNRLIHASELIAKYGTAK